MRVNFKSLSSIFKTFLEMSDISLTDISNFPITDGLRFALCPILEAQEKARWFVRYIFEEYHSSKFAIISPNLLTLTVTKSDNVKLTIV